MTDVNSQFTGTERSAIFLMALGEDDAAKIFQHLSPKEIQSIGQAISSLNDVRSEDIQSILGIFVGEVQSKTTLGLEKDSYIKNVLNKALGKNKAKQAMSHILTGVGTKGLDALKWMDPKTIAETIRNEHPQTIAIVLSYLEPEQASDVLTLIGTNDLKVDIIKRIAQLDAVKPEAIDDLNFMLEKQLSESQASSSANIGGIKYAADILNHLDKEIEEKIISSIKASDEPLSQELEDNMFIFDNLLDIDDRGMQTVLKEVTTDVLIIAMKGASTEIKDKIYKNMSKRAAELLKDDLEAKGPVKLSEVEEAQKEVLEITRKLVDSGEIIMHGSGGDEYV